MTEWSPARRQMAHWLQYYDVFYEQVRQQRHVVDVEIVKSEWAECDIIVDAFFTWFEKKWEEKWKERSKRKDEADPPKAGKHPIQFEPAHR